MEEAEDKIWLVSLEVKCFVKGIENAILDLIIVAD